MSAAESTSAPLRIGMLVFPEITSLDVLAPFEILSRASNCKVQLVWKTTSAVTGDTGLQLIPDVSFADAPQFDVLMVPGGPGQIVLMEDAEVLAFLRKQAPGAKYITSVCTGSLLLAAAGLMRGYKASTHWLSFDQLAQFGVVPVDERVVIDRNRISGGGVTSGLDFAFSVLAVLRGEHEARKIQLFMEYDPRPPFESGHPRVASAALVEEVRTMAEPMLIRRREASAKAAQAMKFLDPLA
ncbi:MAG TPA: DJ-1/PfpI family protein [Luteimonas sp.]|nr:DJ-1/PfpI family protein [Luteimonas sp.]